MRDSKIRFIELPKIEDKEGNLSFFQNNDPIPFKIKRTYWIYDVPGGQYRGGHAFIKQNEFIVALSGSFEVVLNNGQTEKRFVLNRSFNGLFVPNKTWRSLEDFSTNSVALIVSDSEYDVDDYIRDFDEFKKLTENEYNCF